MTVDGARERIARAAPWLLDEALGVCVVGSSALAEACRRARLPGPTVADLDLAWALPLADAESLLARHGVLVPTTDSNRARGTLALWLDGARVEITSFRGERSGTAALTERIREDLARRDMTIGAIAWQLATDRLHDPFGGLADWSARRIEPVGDPAERLAEHPVRWLRWFRRAHALDFALAPSVRRLDLGNASFATIPREAIAGELRRALLELESPGRLLLEMHEAGGLVHLLPELAPQFDGRAAGPVRHHPEVSQALHMILALEWAARAVRGLPDDDRISVLVAVLCHDLGKGITPESELPSHRGHEHTGLPLVNALLDGLPGLTDHKGRRLASLVCELHLIARGLRELRPGTLAKLYDRHFRDRELRVDLFAIALAADSAGRLGKADDGDPVRAQVEQDVAWLRECCERVDARSLRERFPATAEFREALQRERARAIAAGRAARG